MCPGKMFDQASWFFTPQFLNPLNPHLVMMHEEATEAAHRLILRFQNGLGAEIREFLFDDRQPAYFKVLVLRFLGSRVKDFKPLPSYAVPKAGWLNNHEEIIHFCQQVARQPAPH